VKVWEGGITNDHIKTIWGYVQCFYLRTNEIDGIRTVFRMRDLQHVECEINADEPAFMVHSLLYIGEKNACARADIQHPTLFWNH